MQARITTKPVGEVIAAIQALDLESVKVRAMDPELGEGWTREYADSVALAYKHFLIIAVKNQESAEEILPSKDVDEFWHTHILQTMKYADDCQKVFGTFLHHNPHIGKLSEGDLRHRDELAEKTKRFYETEFGPQNAALAWVGGLKTEEGRGFGRDQLAVSSIAIQSQLAAVSSIAIRPQLAAVSSIAISEGRAAVSSIAIRPENGAVSSIAIRADRAAVSSISITSDNAAVSSIAIGAEKTAVSNGAIHAKDAAVSSIAIHPQNAAVSSIAIRA